jgi:hypothetical protein
MRLRMLGLLLPGVVLAQSISYGPLVSNISHSTATVTFVTDAAAANPQVEYGHEAGYGVTVAAASNLISPYVSVAALAGLTPGTTYHLRGRVNGSPASSDVSFTTAPEPSLHPELPQPPASTVDVSMPSGDYGDSSALVVSGDCSNLPSVLQSVSQLSGPLNYEVLIPADAECRGSFVFPARPNHIGWVVVRSNAVGGGAFPGEGTRWTPDWTGSAARFVANVLPVSLRGPAASFSNSLCENTVGNGGYAWATDFDTAPFALYRCADSVTPYAGPSAVTGMSGQDIVTVTAPGHQLSAGDIVSISQNGYIPPQQAVVLQTHGDTFDIRPPGGVPATARFDPSLAPAFTRNEFWRPIGYGAGDSLPASCNTEDWFVTAGSYYWCTARNQWRSFRIVSDQAEDHAALVIPADAARYRFIGLEICPEKLAEPLPAGWGTPVNGVQLQGVVRLLASSHGNQVIWDRCYVHGYPFPQRLGAAFWLTGDNVGFVNSYIDEISWWRGEGYNTYEGSLGLYHTTGGPTLIDNNYIAVAGTGYNTPNGAGPVHDVTFMRNWMKMYPKWRSGDLSNNGYIYSNHSPWMITRGRNFLLAQNFFDYNYSGYSPAPFLALWPGCSSPAGAVPVPVIQDGVLTLGASVELTPGDVVLIRGTNSTYDGLWSIAAAPCPGQCGQLVLQNAPAGSATGGTITLCATATGISDIQIQENTFSEGTDVLWLGGQAWCGTGHPPAVSRIALQNNYSNDLNLRSFANGGRVDRNGTYSNGDYGPRAVYNLGGVEDFTVTGNSFLGNHGLMPSLLRSDWVSEGLNASNNFFASDEDGLVQPVVSSTGGATTGGAALNAAYVRDGQPNWVFDGNVFCCGLSSSVADYPAGTSFNGILPDSDATPSPTQSVSNFVVRAVTQTTFLVEFDASAPVTNFIIEYDLVPTPPFRFSSWKKSPIVTSAATNAIPVSGLAPATQYYWRLKATIAGETIYSSVQTVQTLPEAPDRFRDPTPPNSPPGPSYPARYATTLTAATCADIQIQLQEAAAAAVNGDVKLLIPASFDCDGVWTLPTKTGPGVIVVTTDAPDSALPPDGVRATLDWEPAMPKLRLNTYTPAASVTLRWYNPSDGWIFRGIEITEEFPASQVQPLAGASSGVYTVNTHGFSNGDIVQICNAGSLIRNAEVTVVDSNTFSLASQGTTGTCSNGNWVVRSPAAILALVWMDARSNNVWFDRCIFRLSYWMPITTRYGVNLWCTQCGVVNSYIKDVQGWRPFNTRTGKPYVPPNCCTGEAIAVGLSHTSQVLFENNTVEAPGISIFAEEVAGDPPNAGDMTIRRNLVNWRDELRLGSPTSLGYRVPVRQHLEFKRCERCVVEGSIFRNQWTDGSTGNSAAAIVLTPRCSSSTTGKHNSVNRIQDISIRNNRLEGVNGMVTLLGGETSDRACDVEATQRVQIRNNLATSIDGSSVAALPGVSRVWGNLYYFSGGMEDVTIQNNTSYRQVGSSPVFLMQLFSRSSGLRVGNNLAFMSNDGNGNGYAAPYFASFVPPVSNTNVATRLSGIWFAAPNPDRRTEFTNNVIVPLITNTSSPANFDDPLYLLPVGDCKAAWAGLMNCFGGKAKTGTQRLAIPGFRDPVNGDFSLSETSPFYGQNIGADTDAIDAASGKLRNVQVTGFDKTTAVVAFTRPGDKRCTVEYGTQAAFGTGMRAQDAGNMGRNTDYIQTSVTLSELTPGTQYYYRVLCPAEQPSGSFSTVP